MINANVRKDFQYALEIAGIEQLLIQDITMPDVEWAEILHGSGIITPDVKTPGKKKVGDFTVKKVMTTIEPDNWAWPWFESVNQLPLQGFSRNAILKHISPEGVRTLARYEMLQIWPKKITGLNMKRTGDGELLMEEIVFSCYGFRKLPETGI